MAGGYVQFNGIGSLMDHKPPGSINRYNLMHGVYVHVADETDYKWYSFKESRCEENEWVAKRRLSREEDKAVFIDTLLLARPTVDDNDPNFDATVKRRELEEKSRELDEEYRQYFGTTLSKALKEQKKIKSKGGDK